MKEVPKELRDKVKKYSLMIAWWQLHEEDKKMQDKLITVLKKIEDTEDELRVSGIKVETFDRILESAKKFLSKTVGEMSDRQFETLVKLVFGQKIGMRSFDKRELKRKDVLFYDPMKYARWAKANKT